MERIPDLQRTAEEHARQIAALASSVGSLETREATKELRLAALEKAERDRAILDARREAREEERDKATLEWRLNMDKRMDRFERIAGNLVWIIVSGIGLAFVGWVINGGLKLP